MTLRVVVMLALSVCAACGGDSVKPELDGTPVLTDGQRDGLTGKRIYFGHQSVGLNIMDGVADVSRAEPRLALRITTELQSLPPSGGFFAHSMLGENGKPREKTDAFVGLMTNGFAGRLDVAFHKYCYGDVVSHTDVTSLFSHYVDAMKSLKGRYPRVVFVHVTVPATSVQTGPKAFVKRLVGRIPDGYLDALRREDFNYLLRRKYAGREPLFDLARIEATLPDGAQAAIEWEKRNALALPAVYTPDGGHLNEIGRRHVARELLALLASLASPASASN